jgi:hypothetical protein
MLMEIVFATENLVKMAHVLKNTHNEADNSSTVFLNWLNA